MRKRDFSRDQIQVAVVAGAPVKLVGSNPLRWALLIFPHPTANILLDFDGGSVIASGALIPAGGRYLWLDYEMLGESIHDPIRVDVSANATVNVLEIINRTGN